MGSSSDRAFAGPGRRAAGVGLGVVIAVAAVACGRAPEGRKPQVVVSIPPLAWFVDRLAGSEVEVTVLLPPGATPETYAPGMEAARRIARARLFIRIEHPLFVGEGEWLGVPGGAASGAETLDAAAECRAQDSDPHVWLSPDCARRMAKRVAGALERLAPQQAPETRRRLAALLAEIEEVDADVGERLAPFRGRTFLVLHRAWGYLADAYGLREIGLERAGAGEPGPASVAQTLAEARRLGLHTVFVQPQVSARGASAVGQDLGARIVVLNPLGADWPAVMREAADEIAMSFTGGQTPGRKATRG